MMTEPAMYTSRRQWALEVLGIDEPADQSSIRAGMHARLNECDFVPPPPWREAIDVLTRNVSETTWFEKACESRLRERIGHFSGRLWSLPMEQRLEEFHELNDLAQDYPALLFRMKELSLANEMGLNTETIEDPRVRELAELGRKSLQLVPSERSSHWAAWTAAHADDSKRERREWRDATLRLRERYATLYALGLERFDVLRTEVLKVGRLKVGTRRHGSYSHYWGPIVLVGAVVLAVWFSNRASSPPEPVFRPDLPDRGSSDPAWKNVAAKALAVEVARRRLEAAQKPAGIDRPEPRRIDPRTEGILSNPELRKLLGDANVEELIKKAEAKQAEPSTSAESDAPPTTKFMSGPNRVAKQLPDGTWAPATPDEIPEGILPGPPEGKTDGGDEP